jgi:hypothetical protein
MSPNGDGSLFRHLFAELVELAREEGPGTDSMQNILSLHPDIANMKL